MLTDRCCQIASFELTKLSSIGNLFPLEEFSSSCALEESLELLGETFWLLLFHVFQDYLFRAWWTVDAVRNESVLSGVVYLVFVLGGEKTTILGSAMNFSSPIKNSARPSVTIQDSSPS